MAKETHLPTIHHAHKLKTFILAQCETPTLNDQDSRWMHLHFNGFTNQQTSTNITRGNTSHPSRYALKRGYRVYSPQKMTISTGHILIFSSGCSFPTIFRSKCAVPSRHLRLLRYSRTGISCDSMSSSNLATRRAQRRGRENWPKLPSGIYRDLMEFYSDSMGY